ncbi:MAG: hypothetical protein GTO55_05890 [Armatimonadetes bacterium]|nr:hypothetical protein [Armatimonadota bacterium]NIM23785.1 hypothetical protein [Armatimonadota bacterium]NIM67662.1 hypothetical protein [Armatimonadota bacterium]NIM76178.1 hypothetical protein [Armatimonadota bacterium]NIN05863.1 hypothetical protein [Armatimonadota bacterium]
MKSSSSKSKSKGKEKPTSLSGLWRGKGNEWLILLTAVATVALMAWIISGRSIGIRGEWTWPMRIVAGARFWAPLGGVALLIATAGWLTRPKRWERTRRRWRAVWIIWLVMVAWLLAAGVLIIPQNPVVVTGGIIASPQATSYFSVAVNITDLPATVKSFPALMETFPQHARTHPPGPILFFWGVNRLVHAWPGLAKATEAVCVRLDKDGTEHLSQVLHQQFGIPITRTEALAAVFSAFLLAGLGSLSLIPLYMLASSLYGSTTAMRATLLFATVPSFLLFGPSIDQLVLLFAVLTLWGFLLLRRTGNPLIGLFLALGLLISLGLVAMFAFIGLWWLLGRSVLPENVADKRKMVMGIVGALLIFIGVYVILWLAVGLNLPAIIKAGLAVHRHTTLEEASRAYWKWVIYDPIEFAIFLGLPLMLWALLAVRGDNQRAALGGFALAWVGTLLLLDVSGWVRAETGRIWLFLMPPAALLGAVRLGQLGKRFDLGFFSVLVLQMGQAITMKAGLDIFILK